MIVETPIKRFLSVRYFFSLAPKIEFGLDRIDVISAHDAISSFDLPRGDTFEFGAQNNLCCLSFPHFAAQSEQWISGDLAPNWMSCDDLHFK